MGGEVKEEKVTEVGWELRINRQGMEWLRHT